MKIFPTGMGKEAEIIEGIKNCSVSLIDLVL